MSLKLIAINCTVTYCKIFDQDLQVPQALYSSNSALAAHVSSLDCFRASAHLSTNPWWNHSKCRNTLHTRWAALIVIDINSLRSIDANACKCIQIIPTLSMTVAAAGRIHFAHFFLQRRGRYLAVRVQPAPCLTWQSDANIQEMASWSWWLKTSRSLLARHRNPWRLFLLADFAWFQPPSTNKCSSIPQEFTKLYEVADKEMVLYALDRLDRAQRSQRFKHQLF